MLWPGGNYHRPPPRARLRREPPLPTAWPRTLRADVVLLLQTPHPTPTAVPGDGGRRDERRRPRGCSVSPFIFRALRLLKPLPAYDSPVLRRGARPLSPPRPLSSPYPPVCHFSHCILAGPPSCPHSNMHWEPRGPTFQQLPRPRQVPHGASDPPKQSRRLWHTAARPGCGQHHPSQGSGWPWCSESKTMAGTMHWGTSCCRPRGRLRKDQTLPGVKGSLRNGPGGGQLLTGPVLQATQTPRGWLCEFQPHILTPTRTLVFWLGVRVQSLYPTPKQGPQLP